MEGEANGTLTMEMTSHIPIAQLTPLLNAPSTRSIKAVVTLTWPYSSAKGSIAFLLAEPDFRLRRVRGQVRVQFAGSSAKSIAKAGIASGDEVTLCLDGVEWLEDQTDNSTPGRGLEFELKFTERLYLQYKQESGSELSTIDINYPAAEPEETPAFARIPTPEPSSPTQITNGTPLPASTVQQAADEWTSPAFLKRARTSYGSMFDSDYDPFSDEDGTVRGKGRKKTRLSSVWRVSSRSPTPEEEDQGIEQSITKPPPTMTDEGCQTEGLEVDVAAETLADFARQATNVGGISYTQQNMSQSSPGVESNGTVQQIEIMAMPPPRIQTYQPGLGSDEAMDFSGEAPSSPRLHPIPSDSLPLVSPLVSHAYGFNFGQPVEVPQNTPLEHQLAVPNGPIAADEEDDIYGASPLGRRGESFRHEFNGFQEPSGVGQRVEFPVVAGPYAIEDQYGHWQNSHAQLSHSASPSKADEHYPEENQMGLAYGIEHHYQPEHDLTPSREDDPHTEQYPEIDPQLVADNIRYPELAGHRGDLGKEENSASPPPLHHPAISRSSRSQSVQSPVVDLTEDSDEEEEEDAQGEDEGSLRGSEVEEEYEQDQTVQDYGEQMEVRLNTSEQRGYEASGSEESDVDTDAEGSQDLDDENVRYFENEEEEEEEEEEGEDPERYPRYQQTHNANAGNGYDDEEGSFDEEGEEEYDEDEMEADEQPAAPRGDPVVIDLLSSDEEDEPASNIPNAHQSPSSPILRQSHKLAHESERSEDEEDMEDEDEIPYNERDEIRTYIQRAPMPRQAEADEDAMYDEDDADDESLDDQDEPNGHRETRALHNDRILLVYGSKDETGEEEGSESDEELIHESGSRDVDADDEPQTPENKEASSMQDEPPSQLDGANSAEKIDQSSERPSLLARMFNLDGANNHSRSPTRVSYPTLPKDLSPPASVQGRDSQEPLAIQHTNPQLPTPDVSQPVEKMIITETSFTSTVVQQVSQSSVSEEGHTIMEVESTEVEITEFATRVSPIEAEAPTSDDVPPSSSVEDIQAEEHEKLSENQDIVMSEETERQEIMESTTIVENGDSSMIEEPAEEMEDTHPDVPVNDDASIVSEPRIEGRASSEADQQDEGIISTEQMDKTGQTSVVHEAESSEIGEADESKDQPRSQATTKAKAHAIEEASENAEATESAEQPGPTVTTRAAAHALEESGGDVEPTEPTKQAAGPTVTTRAAAQAMAEADRADEEDPASQAKTAKDQEEDKHNTEMAEEPEFTVDHPRRSHRRVISTAKNDENVPPITPVKSRAPNPEEDTHSQPSPMVVIDAASSPPSRIARAHSPKGHDASIELALSSLESPSKQPHDLRKPPVVDLKLRLSRALRTELSEFTALKVLRYHMNQKLDVLAVATTTPPEPVRAKGGPRHYQISFNITDPSIAPSGVTEVQVFRPYSHALPTISAGDGILLRNFQVTSVQKGFALRSTQDEGSSWAVFKDNEEEPEIRGPPVEYGNGEKTHIIAMKAWYKTLDDTAKAKIARANRDKAAARR